MRSRALVTRVVMVNGEAAVATDGPKSARRRARAGCARRGEVANAKFESKCVDSALKSYFVKLGTWEKRLERL